MDIEEVEYLEEYEDVLRSCNITEKNDATIKNDKISDRLENIDKVNSFKAANKIKPDTRDEDNTQKNDTNISLIEDFVTVDISSILNSKKDKISDKVECKQNNKGKKQTKTLKMTMMQKRKSKSAKKSNEIVNITPPTILPEPYFVDCGPTFEPADKRVCFEGALNSEEKSKTEIENTNKMKKEEHSILKSSSSNHENDISINQMKKEKKIVKFKDPPEEKFMKSKNLNVISTKKIEKMYTERSSQKQIEVSDVKTLIDNNEKKNINKIKKTKCKNKEKQFQKKVLKVLIKKLSSKDLELNKHIVSIDKDSGDVKKNEIVKTINGKNVHTNKINDEINIKDNIKDNKKVKTDKRKMTQKIQNDEIVLKDLKTRKRKKVAQDDILNDTNNKSTFVKDDILNDTSNTSAFTKDAVLNSANNNSNKISILQDAVLNKTNKSNEISASTHDSVSNETNKSNDISVSTHGQKPSTTLQLKKIQSKVSANRNNVDVTNCVIQTTNLTSSSEQLTRSNYNLLKYNEIPNYVCVETKILTSIEFQKLKNTTVNAITIPNLTEEKNISKPSFDDHRNDKNLEMILDDIDGILQKDIFKLKDKVQCIPEANGNSTELVQQKKSKREAILNNPEFNESSLRNILEFLKIYSSSTVATNSEDTICSKQNKNLIILKPDELNKKTIDFNSSKSNSNKNIPKSHPVNESGNLTFKEQKSPLNHKNKLPRKMEAETINLNVGQQRRQELIISKVSEVPTIVSPIAPIKNVDFGKKVNLPLNLLRKAVTTSTPIKKSLKSTNKKSQETESSTFNKLNISGNSSRIFPSESTSRSDDLSNSTNVESIQTTNTT